MPVSPEPQPASNGAKSDELDRSRLAHLPTDLDVGEQLVGSDEWFRVGVPTVIDGSKVAGVAVTEVETTESVAARPLAPMGSPSPNRSEPEPTAVDSAFSASTFPGELLPGSTTPLEVKFSPRRVGEHRAQLTLRAQWTDGVAIQHAVHLHGRARHEADMPTERRQELEAKRAEAKKDEQRALNETEQAPPARTTSAAELDALTAAIDLADNQKDGLLVIAEPEIRSYERRPPAAPWWQALAEIAILSAVSGIAGIVAKSFAAGAVTSMAKYVDMSADTAKLALDGATDAFKETIKYGGKKAATAITATPSSDPATQPGSGQGGASTNPTTAFFGAQAKALHQLRTENEAIIPNVIRSLDPVEKTSPGITDGMLTALAKAFRANDPNAVEQQARATELQWVAGIARVTSPAQEVVNGVVTTQSHLSDYHTDGFLEIEVDTDIPADNHGEVGADRVRLFNADIRGVSQEVADRLWKTDLASVPIPVIIRVHGPGYVNMIRRDEAGRVTVESVTPNVFAVKKDIAFRTADGIASIVLGRTIQAWGIPMVMTDDASGRGDPK